MEWTFAERTPDQSLKAFLAEQIEYENESQKVELLALSEPIGAVCYGAYRDLDKQTGLERVSGLVIPIKQESGSATIGYRLITEYEGPKECRCPPEVFRLLTNFRHCAEEVVRAREWRLRVENWLARKGAIPPLTPGQRLRFQTPVRFDNGDSLSQFIVDGCEPLQLRSDDKPGLYRIPDLMDRIATGEVEVIE